MAKTNKMMLRIIMMAVLVTGLFIAGANPAMAQSRYFWLHIVNGDTIPVTVKVATGTCYEGRWPDGHIETILPGEKVSVLMARNQVNWCNNRQGYFALTLDPKDDRGNDKELFNFDNAGHLDLTGAVRENPNPYSGTLSVKSPKDESYTYTTVKTGKIIPGESVGSLEFSLCSRLCS